MLKTATALITTLGLLLTPALTAGPGPCAVGPGCSAPEPSAVPELGLCLVAIAVGYWLWRRNKKPI
jgi:hypothetical protein